MPKRKVRSNPGPSRPPREGDVQARCGVPTQCRLRELMANLTNEELGLALERAPEPNLTLICRGMGIDQRSRKIPQLIRAKFSRMSPAAFHTIAWMIASGPGATMAEIMGADETANGEIPDDLIVYMCVRNAMARMKRQWPGGLIAVLMECYWDRDFLSSEERDYLIDLALGLVEPDEDVEEPEDLIDDLVVRPMEQTEFCGDAATRERVRRKLGESAANTRATWTPPTPRSLPSAGEDWEGGATEQAEDAEDAEGAEGADGVDGGDDAEGADGLEALLERALVAAAAGAVTGADLAQLQHGLEWLLGLDPERQEWWTLYGRLLASAPGPHEDAGPRLEPPGPTARLRFVLGRLRALVDRDDQEGVGQLVAAQPGLVEQLVGEPEANSLLGPVFAVRLEDPRAAAALAPYVMAPFDGWANVVGRGRERARALLAAGGGGEAEVLLAALEDMLWGWTAGGHPDAAVVREATRTMLLRAECRRRRSDFVGARRLLDSLELGVLDTADRAGVAQEAALAAAELRGLDALFFPRAGDRGRLRHRLQRARPHLESAIDADPAQLVPVLLLGVLATCEADDASAAAHLGRSREWLTEHPELDDLGRAAAFHAALARLRLLEPGTDEGAYLDLAAALDGGYRPGEESLVAAAEALDAHGSPHAGTFLSTIAALAPTSSAIATLVVEWARRGDEDAARTAEELGTSTTLTLVARFELLDAALAGAERRHDAAAAERLVGHIDDVTARAAREALDERWAATLAANEMVRLVLEPHHADALRIEVLRRVGRLDEARHVARSLFHRAAAGTVRDFAAADLLELLGEIGADADELAGLAPLVRERPAPALDPAHLSERQDPVVVLFVGGNEVQAGYRPHVDAGLAERWGEQVRVEWFITGWGTNWGPEAERIETAYDRADAVVLMTFVRTNLGRWVRRTAGEHGLPWVSCTGHGRAAIERSIDYAIRLAQEPAAGRASG